MDFAALKRSIIRTILLLTFPASMTEAAGPIQGRWLGQDKHDYCGAVGTSIAPNGVQDIHIALSGLPARRTIVYAAIKGHGFDEWRFGDAKNQFAAVLLRKPNANTADLFFEPFHVETGREFSVTLKFENGQTVEIFLKGGKADTNLRMPEASIVARWIGQNRDDYTGLGPGVGPDGLQDAVIAIGRLAKGERIKAIRLEGDKKGERWAYGLNPERANNAEFILAEKDPSQGRLYFQPNSEAGPRTLKLTLEYENGKGDTAIVKAGKLDPKLAVPSASLPTRLTLPIRVRRLGQDGHDLIGPGDFHLQLSSLPKTKVVAAAVLSDSVRQTWIYNPNNAVKLDIEPDARPLLYRPTADRTEADLYYPPYRNEDGSTLTLRLIFLDGEVAFVNIPGGPCDPFRRAPVIASGEVVAKPGDDLNILAGRYGTLRLIKGNYPLDVPLILKGPVKLIGERGSTLLFSQSGSQPPWTSAIKIHSGGTTLEGFAIRFATPIRWQKEVNWGPALIGTTDLLDNEGTAPKVNLVLKNLDIETPPQNVTPGHWEEVPKLARLVGVEGGTISGNTLRGGVIEFFGGPWLVEKNKHRGTPPGTSIQAVFAGHDTFDLVLRDNQVKPEGPSGKTWRFLVLTNNGRSDRVERNTVEGVGPRDDDTIPSSNAPEIILTESYQLRFEGKPAAISPDGLILKLPHLRASPTRTGDIVSVVAGRGAGEFRRVAQRVESNLLFLDAPLPKGVEAVVVSPGFVDEVFDGNTIDAQGGGAAAGFVLAGNHFRTRLTNNTIQGAGDAFLLTAFPSEAPSLWGWSHTPFLDAVIEGNVLIDSERGGTIGVMHSRYTKTNQGRLYLTSKLINNTITWSDEFVRRQRSRNDPNTLVGLTMGFERSGDPNESRILESRTTLRGGDAGSRPLRVHATVLNGKPLKNQRFALPNEPKTTAVGDQAAAPELPRR